MNHDAQHLSGTNSKTADELRAKAVQAVEHGNHEYAMDLFEAALKSNPTSLATRRLLHEARIKVAEERPPTAVEKARAASARLKQGSLLKKDPLKALEASDQLLRVDPFSARFLKAHHDAAFAADLPDIAIQALELTKKSRPKDSAILELLNEAYRAQGNVQGQYDCLSALVALEPKNFKRIKELKDTAARLALGRAEWRDSDSGI